MSVFDQVRFVVYRVHEKGLEVMLVQPKLDQDPEVWRIPEGINTTDKSDPALIELDALTQANGSKLLTYAIELEEGPIPSVRGIIKHDVKRLGNKILKVLPETEEGSFFVVKEAFKKVLPNEYAALKELRDVLRDRNSVKYI